MEHQRKYYNILGIQPTEDLNVIKKAYRKAALKFHPDKNPSKEAHLKFIEISLAYEILTNPNYIIKSANSFQPKSKEDIILEKMKGAKERYQRQEEEEARKETAYYQGVASGWKWKLFGLFACYTLIMSNMFCIDFFADSEYKTISHHSGTVQHMSMKKIMSIDGERFSVNLENFWYEKSGYPAMYVSYSYLFHDLKTVNIITEILPEKKGTHSDRMRGYELFDKYEITSINSHTSIYGAFPLLHFVLMVPALLMILRRPTLRFNIWRLVSIWIIYPFMIFFTFSNDRIYHLFNIF